MLFHWSVIDMGLKEWLLHEKAKAYLTDSTKRFHNVVRFPKTKKKCYDLRQKTLYIVSEPKQL
jgi:hypothetical protein